MQYFLIHIKTSIINIRFKFITNTKKDKPCNVLILFDLLMSIHSETVNSSWVLLWNDIVYHLFIQSYLQFYLKVLCILFLRFYWYHQNLIFIVFFNVSIYFIKNKIERIYTVYNHIIKFFNGNILNVININIFVIVPVFLN